MGARPNLHVMPEGGWTRKNIKEYREGWWRKFYENAPNMKDWSLLDPEGRLKKGQRIRWNHSEAGSGDMEVIHLCAPTGLYRRPLRDDDEDWMKEHAALMGTGVIPCEATEEGAVYRPENLMVFFRYLYNNEGTTGHAIHMVVVSETLSPGKKPRRAKP